MVKGEVNQGRASLRDAALIVSLLVEGDTMIPECTKFTNVNYY